MSTKVVYNACYGGFNLSKLALERLAELGCPGASDALQHSFCGCYCFDIPRHDPLLVQVVEELGDEASGQCARLRIEEIEGDRYLIDDYDGRETIQTSIDADWIYV